MKRNESGSVVSDSLWPHELYSPWNSPGQNTGVGSFSLCQGIFPTQGLNPGLLHCRWDSLPSEPPGRPKNTEWVAYPFSSRSSWLRNQTRVSCFAGRFFTNWTIREEGNDQTISKKKKCKKAKWMSEESSQITEERREANSKRERERYAQLNAEFQRIAIRDKRIFLNEQRK